MQIQCSVTVITIHYVIPCLTRNPLCVASGRLRRLLSQESIMLVAASATKYGKCQDGLPSRGFWIPVLPWKDGNDTYGGNLFSLHFGPNHPCPLARDTMKHENVYFPGNDTGSSIVKSFQRHHTSAWCIARETEGYGCDGAPSSIALAMLRSDRTGCQTQLRSSSFPQVLIPRWSAERLPGYTETPPSACAPTPVLPDHQAVSSLLLEDELRQDRDRTHGMLFHGWQPTERCL